MGGIYRTRMHIVRVAEVKGHSRSFKVIRGHQLYIQRNMQFLFYVYENFNMQNHSILEENFQFSCPKMRPKCHIFARIFVRIALFRSLKYKMG